MSGHDIYVLLNYISVFIMFFCCVVISTHSGSRMQKLAMLVCASLTMCCLGFLFRSEASDADAFIIGQKLIYTFVTHGMFLMLLFILEYCKFSVPKWVQYIFHSLNFLISLAVLTLDHHPFFYKSYWAVSMGDYCILEKEYGFLHTVAVGLFGLYMAAAVIITVIFSIKNLRRRSRYAWRILIAVLLPCISYIIPKFTDSENDLQPIAFAAFSVMVLYMIYRNNLYDVDNIAASFSIESMDEAIMVFDGKYLFQGCNKRAEQLFPVLKSLNLDGDIRPDSGLITDFLDGKISEYRDGEEVYSVQVRPIRRGHVTQGAVIKLENITLQRHYTDLLQASKEHLESEVVTLSNYSYTDDLTGLNNRRSFEDVVNEIRAKGSAAGIIVGSADVNGLKAANDNICHAAGDELIKAAAATLDQIFSPYGKVFRTGGDEFYVILTSAPKDLSALTDAFEAAVKNWHGSFVDHFSVSYGFVCGTEEDSAGIDKLLIDADREMYRNKRRYYEKSGIDRRKSSANR